MLANTRRGKRVGVNMHQGDKTSDNANLEIFDIQRNASNARRNHNSFIKSEQDKARARLQSRLTSRSQMAALKNERLVFHGSHWNILQGAMKPARLHSHHVVVSKQHQCLQCWVHTCAITDICIWLVFLILFVTYIQYGVLSSPEAEFEMSKYSRRLIGGVESLEQVEDEASFYDFLDSTLIPNLLPDTDVADVSKFLNVSNDSSLNSVDGRIFVPDNKVWLRQIRTTKADWDFDSVDTVLPEKCKSLRTKHSSDFVEDVTSPTQTQFSGRSATLSGSGFVEHIDLHLAANTSEINLRERRQLTLECAKHTLNAIKQLGWVDQWTRAIFVEYCIVPWYGMPHMFNKTEVNNFLFPGDHSGNYHPTAGVCQRLVFRVHMQGSIVARQASMTTPIRISKERTADFSEVTYTYFTTIIILCVLLCIMKETTELAWAFSDKIRLGYYLNIKNLIWNILDVIIVVSLIWTVHRFPKPDEAPFGEKTAYWKHPTFERFKLIEALSEAKGAFAIVLLLWYVRGVEYMSLFPWFQLPIYAMKNSFYNIMSFGTFFVFIMWGASVAFRFLFNTTAETYATLERSLTTLSLGLLGELQYEDVLRDYRFHSVELFSITWAFLAAFVLLTMFVAIVDQGFQDAKDELQRGINLNEAVFVTQHVDNDEKLGVGHIIEYEGSVDSVNNDGTFNIRFTLHDEEYVDKNLEKHHVRLKHPPDLTDGVLFALLRLHLQPIITRFHVLGFCIFKKRGSILCGDRLMCRPLRYSDDAATRKCWYEQLAKYINFRKAAKSFMIAPHYKGTSDHILDKLDSERQF